MPIAHISLEARVGPRLEQRLDAGSAAGDNRPVQRRVVVLPKRGGGPTPVGERRWRHGAEGRRGAIGAPPARGAGGQRHAASRAQPLTLTSLAATSQHRAAAHIVLGIQFGALGDEVLEAVELAGLSRIHERRAAGLWRRGGGATRGERRR